SPTSLWTGTAIENSAARRNKLGEKLGIAKKWLLWESIGNEKKMYEPIRAFIEFVALVVQGELSSMAGLNTRSELGRRLVLPSLPSDFKPDDADDNTRIDKGLVSVAPDSDVGAPRARPRYYDLLAVLEAKVKDGDFKDAFQQLVGYTRQMFQEQHTLRFAWGLTVSGRNVRVCHFGPDKATSSRPMSVSSLDGRRAFVETLVNWSFCEQSQLGRDPTMAYLPELGCWEIACPDDTGSADDRTRTTSYYFKVVSCHADRVFGRHTRCFLATGKKPAQMVSDENPLIPEVVIKDSWAFANPDSAADTRDEVKTLKRIKSGLSEHMDRDDIIIPEIIVGGRVRFELNGKWVEDNIATMYQQCETDGTASAQLQPGEIEDNIGARLHDSLSNVLNAKRSNLGDSDTFEEEIVDHFKEDDEVELLKGLALKLYSYLFENRHLGSNCHGMAKKRVEKALPEISLEEELGILELDEFGSLPSGGHSRVNPFEERAKEWEKISGHLLSITNRFGELAIKSQKAAIEATSSAAVDNNSE
ncbi:hypothetical protein LPJ60_005987, partial [Coemansia sp. RSA 2675]